MWKTIVQEDVLKVGRIWTTWMTVDKERWQRFTDSLCSNGNDNDEWINELILIMKFQRETRTVTKARDVTLIRQIRDNSDDGWGHFCHNLSDISSENSAWKLTRQRIELEPTRRTGSYTP